MRYFIGIVPPDSYLERIEDLRGKWPNHKINHAVEPHITLKAQPGLTPDEEWIETVREICKEFQPFQVKIGKPRYFFDNILYLSIESETLMKLHRKLVHAITPSPELSKQYFELDDFVPHISIGKTFYGLAKSELIEMEKLAEKELTPYPTFEVNFIRIYQEVEHEVYRKYVDIPLN